MPIVKEGASGAAGVTYVTVEDVRALRNLSDAAKFPQAEIADAIEWFETTFEDYTGVAWVPRTRRVTLHGSGMNTLILPDMYPRRLISLSVYTAPGVFTSYSASDLAVVALEASGVLRHWSGYFPRGSNNIVVEYEHGLDAPPRDVREAALRAIRNKLLDNNTGSRHWSVQTEAGVVRNYLPGPDRPFGDAEVDAVANRRSMRGDAASVAIG